MSSNSTLDISMKLNDPSDGTKGVQLTYAPFLHQEWLTTVIFDISCNTTAFETSVNYLRDEVGPKSKEVTTYFKVNSRDACPSF
jgi:hypothetical protein